MTSSSSSGRGRKSSKDNGLVIGGGKSYSCAGELEEKKSRGWNLYQSEKGGFSGLPISGRSGAGMDRPLPPRTEGGGRGKGIDLLTPL